jgi:hypothetical protein
MWAKLLSVVVLSILLSLAAAERTKLTNERIAVLLHTLSRSQVQMSNPGAGSAAIRARAIGGLAIFESVNSIVQKYEPYLVQLSEIPATINVRRAHQVAAAATAIRYVLDWMYPGNVQTGTRFFHREIVNSMVNSIKDDAESVAYGKALGKYVAERLIANRTNDGLTDPPATRPTPNVWNDCSFAWGTEKGLPGSPFSSAYGFDVRAFGTTDPLWYNNDPLYYVPPPPACDSPANFEDYREVFGYGAISNPANATWTATTNLLGQYHAGYYGAFNDWNYDVLTTADIQAPAIDIARVIALSGLASHDSHGVHWVWKYTYLRARPITAFRSTTRTVASLAQFYDPLWFPTIATANTPEYPSGHSSHTSANVEIFRLAFGDQRTYTISSYSVSNRADADLVASRTYTSFTAMINEVNDARVMAGVHYRTSVDAATDLGLRIARNYWERLLRPLPGYDDDEA